MRIRVLSLLLAFAFVLMPVRVFADSTKPAVFIPLPQAQQYEVPKAKKYLVPVAQLMRVDEGVFELEVGKTIDLTDRKILLSVRCEVRRKVRCFVSLNGDRVSGHTAGSRIDLKEDRDTKEFVQDKEVCFLDIVDVALPKGAPGIFTFRLHCL